ncbi:MAG TPA: hypothetical protein VIF62_32240 [Labilithrix sp.]
MRARWLFGIALGVAGAAACVDLFHGTDFTTFCTVNPTDPACGGDGGGVAEAGRDASPPIDFCTLSSADSRRYAEHACAWLGACEGPVDSTKMGTCLAQAILAYDCGANANLRPRGATLALWECLAQTKSCGDVDACVFQGGVQACQPVGSGGMFTACGNGPNAAVRVQCTSAGRPSAVEPCALTGRTCTTRNESVAECTGTSGKSCAGTKCAGTSAVVCGTGGDSMIDRGLDCASYGAGACVMTANGPACKPSDSVACSGDAGDGTTTCASSIALTCVGGSVIRTACDALDSKASCVADAGIVLSPENVAACGPNTAGGATIACTADDACSGNTLTSCDQGIKYVVDCNAQGLGACRTTATGLAQCSAP